jgi:hypothetical protein
LQFANLVANNADVAKLADAGSDRIGNFVTGDDFVNHGARTIHGLARVRGQEHRAPFNRDLAHRF